MQKAVEWPVKNMNELFTAQTPAKPVDLVALQDSLLRFTDSYVGSVSQSTGKLKRDGVALSREQQVALNLKLTSDMLSLATSANSLINLINMVVYVSTMRIMVGENWTPSQNGMDEMPLLAVLRDREENIWEIASQWLTAEQRLQLRQAIEQWRKIGSRTQQNSSGFASISLVNQILSDTEVKEATNKQSVFTLLDIDPLASLDPAAKELTETRLFGERTLFLSKRMPQIIAWQLEQLTAQSIEQPEVKAMVSSAEQIAAAGVRIGGVLEQAPSLIRSERKNLIAELNSAQAGLTALSVQFGSVFEQGGKMAEATGKTLEAFRALTVQLNENAGHTGSQTFDVHDYEVLAARVDTAAEHLTELLRALQPGLEPAAVAKLTALIGTLTQQTQQSGQAMIDYAYRKILTMVVLSVGVVSIFTVVTFFICKCISIKLNRTM
ncbi:hypothetical protein F6R98_14590 [Candidatus Methylospira mobilis]|uniref:Uncharacterized protein n=2 Tax=Candidatus Methylospira mobilis TaxID=1808979 RepID=A0A5Q0BIQ9_9GAMM|nr:hypothetical protein F6R98_14590 [Candidatus Methylospira mobilis]